MFTRQMAIAVLLAGVAGAGPRHKQILSGYQPPKEKATAPLPKDRVVHLALALEPRDAAALAKLADDVSDPKSAQFQKFQTAAQLIERFSPSQADYQKVIDWAKANHFSVEHQVANRLLVAVSGKASDVESALAVTLSLAKRADGSEFYKPDRAPSVDLDVKLAHIGGVDNRFVPRHHGGSLPGYPGLYGAHDLRRAYLANCWGLHGANQNMGITAYGGYDHNNIATYQTFNSLPQSTAADCGNSNPSSSPCLHDVMVPPFTGAINNASDETTMDVEMAVGMAPQMHEVVVFEADYTADPTGDTLIASMASWNAGSGPKIFQFSTSNGFNADASNKNNLNIITMQGATFFSASGDIGTAPTIDNGTFYGVLATKQIDVGGTELTMDTGGLHYVSEQAWHTSGGGVEVSNIVPVTCTPGCTPGDPGCPDNCIPTWQKSAALGNGASPTYRNDPDVAMAAMNIYVKLTSINNNACGTSLAAPLWAAFMASINEQRCRNNSANCTTGSGYIAPLLYQLGHSALTGLYHDATTLSPNTCGFSGQAANPGTGYDLATGWGSPTCPLIAQLACTTCSGSTASPGTPPSASCVNFQNDNNNCGTCANMCNGTSLVCIAGQCLPPGTVGDTHITTLDGLYYDFQATGDFLLVSTGPMFVVQTRQVSGAPTWPNAAVNVAVAMQIGAHRVAFFRNPDRVIIDGKPTPINGRAVLSDNITINREGDVYTVQSAAGETVRVSFNAGYMNVIVGLGYAPDGAARGLLGNGNGKPDDDLLGREGKPLALPLTFADLYGVYGEGVRVNPRESLFGDEKGAVYTPPAKPFYAADLDGALYEKARATCAAAGIKHEALLDACTLDVAVLGTDAATKSFAGAPPPAKVMQPGQHPRAQPGCGCDVTSTGDAGLVTLAVAALWLAWRRRRAAPAR